MDEISADRAGWPPTSLYVCLARLSRLRLAGARCIGALCTFIPLSMLLLLLLLLWLTSQLMTMPQLRPIT